MKNSIRFIVNGKAGTGSADGFEALMRSILYSFPEIEAEVCLTQAPGHASILAREAVHKEVSVVVAVGGDGTVNETAAGLTGSKTPLGIIPTGSGNGLARHMNIPLKGKQALRFLFENYHTPLKIDTALLNDRLFLCTAGTGFDAHISQLFADSKTRGLQTYARIALREFRTYTAGRYRIRIDNEKPFEENAFLITVANASQFGNDIMIAPEADIQDGFLDMRIVVPESTGAKIKAFTDVLIRRADKSRHILKFRFKTAEVERLDKPSHIFHTDGEPGSTQEKLLISTAEKSLSIIGRL